MKPKTLNAILYDHVQEEESCKIMSVNNFRDDDDDPLIEQDPTYIRCQIYNEIPERLYSIECEGYVDKNGKPLDNETTIKHLT